MKMRRTRISNWGAFVELLIGIITCFIIAETIILLFTDRILYNTVGLLIGSIYAGFSAYHIAKSVDESVYMGDEGDKHFRKGYILRVIVMIVIFALFYFFDIGNALVTLVGMMSLKWAAYIQPITHKIINKMKGW